jgi:hypothetical protein
VTSPDAYWEEAHAAFHRLAAEDARIWAEAEADAEPEAVPADCAPDAVAERLGVEPEAEPW